MTTLDSSNSTAVGSTAQRVAAGALVLWGLLHLVGGVVLIVAAGGSGQDAMASFASGLTAGPLAGDAASALGGLLGFHGFNIAAAGAAVTVLGWRARRQATSALTVPILIAMIADVGLVVFFLAPGVMLAAEGAPGVVLLAIAVAAALRAGWRPVLS